MSSQDEVIVADGNSQDRTREIAKKSGAKLLELSPPPEGWIGKAWACFQGARVASKEILVFLDADTVLEKNGLQNTIGTYIEEDGVLSIQPYHRMHNLYEQLSAFFNIVAMAGMGTFTALGRRIKPLGLFGPAIVMRRQDYLDSGGHQKVSGEIVDDLALGAELLRQGMKVRCLAGKGTVCFRMYPNGIKELINGWAKGFAIGAAKTSTPLLVLIVLWICGSIDTTRSLIEAAIATNRVEIGISGGVYALYAAQIYWMVARIGNFKLYTAVFYPIFMAFFVLVFIYSFVRIFLVKSVRWKDMVINLNRTASK